jgi:threonine dehydrogenase-like Zn-dependent dehydrogenase
MGHITVVGGRGTSAGPKLSRQRPTHDVFTVVIWGAGLLGAAAMMALLFLWLAG